MKIESYFLGRRILVFFLGLSMFVNVILVSNKLTANESQDASHRYQYTLQTLLHYMNTFFVDSVPEEKLLEGAVRGMLSAGGDPYTRFLNKKQMKEFSSMEGGSKIGVGIELVIEAGEPVITAPLKGGPASKAGILSGDVITTVDGKKTKGLGLQKLAGLITGKKGTSVVLGVRRSGFSDDINIEIIRGVFNLKYVNTSFFQKEKVGYIQLTHFFGSQTGSLLEFEKGVESMIQKRARGIVIDLRDNTGGHLDMATALAGMFLKKGSVIVKARGRYTPWNKESYSTQLSAGKFTKIPLVVLVNAYSASASEIMAGALQDYKRAKLVGVKTFGKASVQKIVRSLPEGAGAMITIQKYYTPKDRGIHGVGLQPDVEVKSVKLNDDEKFYYYKLNKEKYFVGFVKKNPLYKKKLSKVFVQEMKLRGWGFRLDVANKVLKRVYHIKSGTTDIESDKQLQSALKILSKVR